MVNRAEVSLSNPSLFSDVTAWRAIRNVDRKRTQCPQVYCSDKKLNYQNQTPPIPVTIYQPEKPQAMQPTTNIISELNGQLSVLWQQKKEGKISSSYYRIRQKELAEELHTEMERKGYKSIRKKHL